MKTHTIPSVTRRDVAIAIVRRWRLLLVVLVASWATTLAVLSVWPFTYEARGQLLIRFGREMLPGPSVSSWTAPQVVTSGLRKEDVNTEVDMLTSRHVSEAVVDKLGVKALRPPPPEPRTVAQRLRRLAVDVIRGAVRTLKQALIRVNLSTEQSDREKVIRRVMKNLEVGTSSATDTVDVSFLWTDQDTAAVVLREMIATYLDVRDKARSSFRGYEFIKREVDQLRERIARTENSLRRYRGRSGVYRRDEQADQLIKQVGEIRSELFSTRVSMAEQQRVIAGLEGRLEEFSKRRDGRLFDDSELLTKYRERLLGLELERVRRESTRSALSGSLEREIEALDARLAEEGIARVERELRAHREHLAALGAREAGLADQIRDLTAQLDDLTGKTVEVRRLERKLRAEEGHLALYGKLLEESRVAAVLDRKRISSVKLVTPVIASERPVKPRKVIIAAVGLFASTLIAFGIAFVSGWYHNTLNDRDDVVNGLGIPLLGHLSEDAPV